MTKRENIIASNYPFSRTFEAGIDLSQIADSGQCFRWLPINADDASAARIFSVVSGNARCLAEQVRRNTIRIWFQREEDGEYWANYFSVNQGGEERYRQMYRLLEDADDFSAASARRYEGMRILRQDPFETIASFIISQNNNIVRIRKIIGRICGEEDSIAKKSISLEDSALRPLFPDARQLGRMLSEGDYGLGYRYEYLRQLCRDWISGKYDNLVLGYAKMDTETVLSVLLTGHGIGPKVASCISLFAFDKIDCAPRDVWIKRAESEKGVRWLDEIAGFQQQVVFAAMRSQ